MGIPDNMRPFHAFSGTGRYVCVSYARRDSGPVYDILERLYTDGYNIWYDEGLPQSDELERRSQQAAAGCEVFLIFISPSSTKGGSDAMRQLEYARTLKKPIIYVTMDCLGMPDGMESFFQGNRMITGDENEAADSLRGAIPAECRGAARREPARFDISSGTSILSGGQADSETASELAAPVLVDDGSDEEEYETSGTPYKTVKPQAAPEPPDERFEYYFSGDSGLTLVKYNGSDEEVVMYDLRDGYPVTAIGDQAFMGCERLRRIRLPSTITSIGHTAFRDCRSLVELQIPYRVKEIGPGAFYGCSSVSKLTVPDSVKAIGEMAFRGCSSLSRVTIPDSVTVIGDGAFADCMLLIIECLENSYPHWYAAHNNIPFRLISPQAMENRLQPLYGDTPHKPVFRSAAEKPSTVRNIRPSWEEMAENYSASDPERRKKGASPVFEPSGDQFAYLCFADEDYPQLKDLINDTVSSGYDVCRCPDPRQGATVREICEVYIRKCRTFVLFLSRNALQSGRVAEHELELALGSAADRMLIVRLDSIPVPEALRKLGTDDMINRMLLSSDEMKAALAAHLGSAGCGRERSLLKTNTRFTADDYEFIVKNSGAIITRYLGSKPNVEIPARLSGYGVIALGNRLFEGNTSITSVTIPSTVTDLGVELFKGCRSLTRIILPNTLGKIGYGTFRDCVKLKEINLPSTVTEIGWHAFAGCSSLSSMAVPIRVSKIENWAFDGCLSLGKISIPDHVTKIDVNAFFNCSKRLTILSTKGSYAQKFAMQNGYKWKRVR